MRSNNRTTKDDIRKHINFIENYSSYRIEKDHTETTTTYLVKLNKKTVAIIKSKNNSDIWDMLEPFWKIAFENKKEDIRLKKEMETK